MLLHCTLFGLWDGNKIWLIDLPWEIQKSYFSTVLLQIIYIILEKNKLLPLYPPHVHTWKMSPHYLVKCTTFSSDWRDVAFLQTVALRKSRLWLWSLSFVALKRTGCDVWQMGCQTSKVTANVQSDHLLDGCMLPVFHHWWTASSTTLCWNSALSQQDASTTRPHRIGTWYAWKIIKNLCILQGSAVTFFRCGGQRSNSFFSSEIT